MKEQADAIRNKFFAAAIPTNKSLTGKCLAAGAALLAFLNCYGIDPRLFNRDEFYFSPTCRRRMADILAELIAGVESLPDVAGSHARRVNALAKLRAYQGACL